MVDPILLSIFSFLSVFVFGSHIAYRTSCCGNSIGIETGENEFDFDLKRNNKELLHIEFTKDNDKQNIQTIIPFSEFPTENNFIKNDTTIKNDLTINNNYQYLIYSFLKIIFITLSSFFMKKKNTK
jgi:hypothetical protein